jgi:hypothetical protein
MQAIQRTATHTHNNISYSSVRLERLGWDLDSFDGDKDLFINGNLYNVKLDHDLYDSCFDSCADFEKLIEFDEVDDSGGVVFLYLLKGRMVAWYDCENYKGYIDV